MEIKLEIGILLFLSLKLILNILKTMVYCFIEILK